MLAWAVLLVDPESQVGKKAEPQTAEIEEEVPTKAGMQTARLMKAVLN